MSSANISSVLTSQNTLAIRLPSGPGPTFSTCTTASLGTRTICSAIQLFQERQCPDLGGTTYCSTSNTPVGALIIAREFTGVLWRVHVSWVAGFHALRQLWWIFKRPSAHRRTPSASVVERPLRRSELTLQLPTRIFRTGDWGTPGGPSRLRVDWRSLPEAAGPRTFL